jgi:hypothetical protein
MKLEKVSTTYKEATKNDEKFIFNQAGASWS